MAAEDPHLPETRCGIRIAGHAPQKFRFQPLFQAGHRAEGLSAPGLPELTKIYLARQPPAGPRTYNREVLKRAPWYCVLKNTGIRRCPTSAAARNGGQSEELNNAPTNGQVSIPPSGHFG
jgi:hypothetical protein